MRSRFVRGGLVAVIALLVPVLGALAQGEADKSGFVSFLETMISTSDRQVTLTGLQGALSSNPTVERITVSDREGPWLELEGVSVEWSRAALLRRRLDIQSLRAREVALLRTPLPPAETRPAEGAGGLPVAVDIEAMSLPRIVIAEPVLGVEAELAASGSAELMPDALSAELSVFRQDRAGSLTAELRFQPDANTLVAELTLEEPADGLVAELLQMPSRPAITARLSGEGPLDAWNATLNVAASGQEVLGGSMSVTRLADAYRIAADMAASLESVAPADYAPLVAGESRLALDVTRFDDGAITVDTARLRSAGTEISAGGMLTPDLVPRAARLSLRLGQAGRAALPFVPGDVSVATLQVDGALEEGTTSPWRIGLVAEGVENAHGSFARLTASANGEAQSLADPAARSTAFRMSGAVEELTMADPDMDAAIGPEVQLAADGSWSAGGPVDVENAQLVIGDAAVSFMGAATAAGLDGRYGVIVSELSRFAALAGRPLAGGARVEATGTATAAGQFDLVLDGETVDLALGVAALDPLIAGATTVRGGVARDGDGGLAFDGLALANDRMSAEVNGAVTGPELDLNVAADVADLSLVTERAEGAASVSAALSGTSAAPRVEAEASGDEIVLMGRPLTDARARFSGVIAGPDTAGEAEIGGTLGDAAVTGSAVLSAGEDGARRIADLVFAVGDSRATGDVTLRADGLFSGNVNVVSPDLSRVAPLFLVDARGMLQADIGLSAEDGSQSASVSAVASDVVYENVTLERAEIEGRAQSLLTAPEIAGSFAVRNLRAGGLAIVTATGTAARQGDATLLTAEAALADGRAALEASLAPRDGGIAIGLDRFTFVRSGMDMSLAAPTTIGVADGTALFDSATLNAGGGSATVSGRAGRQMDLAVRLNAVPARLVNSFSPTLAAEGTISGTVSVTGTAASPVADFDIAMAGASVAASRNAGLGPLGISVQGDFRDGTVDLASRITGSAGLAVGVNGIVGTGAGTPLNLSIDGAVPLSLGNAQLAARGAALSGVLTVDMGVTGTAASPQFAGSVTSEGGGFVDPQSGIVLSNLSLAASVSNNRLVIDRLNAASGEGTVAASGSLGLDPNEGLPVDIAINVRQARYVDGSLVAARFDADLTLTGNLTGTPVLSGSVLLDRTEITVPERLPGDSVAVSVEHVAPPPPVERTLEVVRERQRRETGDGGGASGIQLDVTVNAPRQVFVRGRGLDSEFGGEVQLRGPIASIVTAGSFEIVRGRIDILTQRIVLDRGIITFAGDLDPILDFVGTTRSGDVTITVTISGRASDPEVNFSSIPELPQDEVLAQLIFQKGIGELSPIQIARLGAAAAELAGGSGGGILSQLRQSTGLDDLDIVMDEEGGAALAAGRYVSENVYIGVQQGTSAESSRVTIDLDITDNVKARAGYSARGDSSLGIFYEREY